MARQPRWIYIVTWISVLLIPTRLTATSLAATSNNTRNSTIEETKPFSCQWRDNEELPITYGPAIGCSICVIIGFILIIFGYKYRKLTLFLVGFSSGALLAYLICVVRSTLGILYILLLTAAVAIFLGIICAVVMSFGLVASGIGAGICLSFAFLLAFSSLYEYETLSIPVGILVGVAVLMAGATVWWKRVFLIISTSVYGGALIMGPVDYFIEDLWLLDYVWRKVFLVQYHGKPCYFSWIVLGVWPLMVTIGLMLQFLKTAKKPSKANMSEFPVNFWTGGTLFDQHGDDPFADEVDTIGLTLFSDQSPSADQTSQRFNPISMSLLAEQIQMKGYNALSKHQEPSYKAISCDRNPSQNEDIIGLDERVGAPSTSCLPDFTAQDCTMAIKISYDGDEIERLELTSQESTRAVHFNTSADCYEPLDARPVMLPCLNTCSHETQEVLEQMSRGLIVQMTNDGDVYATRLCPPQVFCTNGMKEAIRLHREGKIKVFDYQNEFLPNLQPTEDCLPPSSDITFSLGRADGSLVAIVITHAQAKKQVDQAFSSVERFVSEPNPYDHIL